MDKLPVNNYLLDIAANKKMFVIVRDAVIEILETASRKVVRRVKVAGTVEQIKVCPNSTKLAWTTSQPSAGLYVYSVEDSSPVLYVENERTENGFSKLFWSPNSLYLTAVGDHMVFIDVYNTKDPDRPVITLNGPLHDSLGNALCAFSPDSYYFATCERVNFRYCVILFATEHDWTRVQEIDIADIIPGGICWCCDSSSFLLWQSLPRYHLQHITLDGTKEYVPGSTGDMAICNVEISACGRMAAVQLDNGNIEIHDLLLRRQASELVHSFFLHHPRECRSVLRVPVIEDFVNTNNDSVCYVDCENEDRNILISFKNSSVVKYPREDLRPKFSMCGKYLASYDPSCPTVIWIWELFTQSVDTAVLLNRKPLLVHEMQWHSVEPQLAVTLEVNRVLLWSSSYTVLVVNSVAIPPLTAVLHFAIIESRAENNDGDSQFGEDGEADLADNSSNSNSINGNE